MSTARKTNNSHLSMPLANSAPSMIFFLASSPPLTVVKNWRHMKSWCLIMNFEKNYVKINPKLFAFQCFPIQKLKAIPTSLKSLVICFFLKKNQMEREQIFPWCATINGGINFDIYSKKSKIKIRRLRLTNTSDVPNG